MAWWQWRSFSLIQHSLLLVLPEAATRFSRRALNGGATPLAGSPEGGAVPAQRRLWCPVV